MNDEAFSRLVAEEVKNKATAAQKNYLAMPANLERWKRALQFLSKNLEEQIVGIDRDEKERLLHFENLGEEGSILLAETSATAAVRRAKIDRFRFFVSQKLDEVSRLALAASQSANSTEDFYRRAIEKWWSLMQDFEMEPTKIDYALFASLDGKWEFDDLSLENNFDDFED